MVAGVPVCPQWSLDHYHGLEVGFGNVSPGLDKKERWLGAEWQVQGLNYSMNEPDSREPRVVLPDTYVFEKTCPHISRHLIPFPGIVWFGLWAGM